MLVRKLIPDLKDLPFGKLALLWFVGWTLRVTVLATPPLAADMRDSYLLDAAGVGALTMLPIVAIAFGAIPAAWFIQRFGVKATIVGGIVVMALASMARGFMPGVVLLLSVSTVMGLGVAAFQTALPAAVKAWTPKQVAFGSAVYLNGMMVGEFFGAGMTLPVVMPLASGNWQTALVLWSLPVLLVALWTFFSSQPATRREVESWNPRLNDGQTWQFGLLLAGSVVVFYIINAYAAVTLEKRGEGQALALFLLAFNLTPLIASFVMLGRSVWVGQRLPVAVSGFAAAAGLAGFVMLDGPISWIFAVIAGFAATIELILLMSLPSKIAEGMAVSRLNAGMTALGYGVAFLIALFGGWLAAKTGMFEMALWPALIFAFASLALTGRSKTYRCTSASA